MSSTEPAILLTDQPSPADREAILASLVAHNRSHVAGTAVPLAVLLCDPDTGETLGGLWGRTVYDWLFVELLSLPERFRGQRLGSRLMAQAEATARERGCVGIWLDTYSFQARGFYEKLGFTVFGTIEDYPPGHQRFFLQKRLG